METSGTLGNCFTKLWRTHAQTNVDTSIQKTNQKLRISKAVDSRALVLEHTLVEFPPASCKDKLKETEENTIIIQDIHAYNTCSLLQLIAQIVQQKKMKK